MKTKEPQKFHALISWNGHKCSGIVTLTMPLLRFTWPTGNSLQGCPSYGAVLKIPHPDMQHRRHVIERILPSMFPDTCWLQTEPLRLSSLTRRGTTPNA